MFAYEGLFDETIAETLLHAGWIGAELAQLAVGIDPLPVLCETRVGLDQGAAANIEAKEAV